MKKTMSGTALTIMFIFGMTSGIATSYLLMSASLERIASNIRIENIEIGFNQSSIIENQNKIIWDLRMQNCTKTEKGYCAIECYENGHLTPCENFTNDEHFCNNGKCEVNGVCPTYYEILRGKTLRDCMKEVQE